MRGINEFGVAGNTEGRSAAAQTNQFFSELDKIIFILILHLIVCTIFSTILYMFLGLHIKLNLLLKIAISHLA